MEQLKLKIKLQDVVDIRINSVKFFESESLPISMAFKLGQFQKKIWELYEDFNNSRNKALASLGKRGEKFGTFLLDTSAQEKFDAMNEELMNTEVEVDSYSFTLAEFGDIAGIPPAAIRPLIKYGVIKE